MSAIVAANEMNLSNYESVNKVKAKEEDKPKMTPVPKKEKVEDLPRKQVSNEEPKAANTSSLNYASWSK